MRLYISVCHPLNTIPTRASQPLSEGSQTLITISMASGVVLLPQGDTLETQEMEINQ